MRPIHMIVGERHLVRIDVPGGAHVRFEQGEGDTPFPSQAELKRRADEAAAQVLRPLSPHILCLALSALVLAATATALSLDRPDRSIELAERV